MTDRSDVTYEKHDWLIAAALAIAAGVVFSLLFTHKFHGLRSNDECHYSEIGRNLYRGEGFTTKAITPVELAIDRRVERHPNLWRPPLYPLMICAAYAVVGTKEYGGVLVSGLFFVLLAPAIYWFVREVSGRVSGLAAGVTAILLPELWDYSLHTLTEMPFAFLLILLLYALHRGAHPFVTGTIFGLCYLQRYNALSFLPAVIWFLGIIEKHNWRGIVKFSAGAFLVMSPWLIRNMIVSGSPMFSLQNYMPAMFTDTFPGYYLYVIFDRVDPLNLIRQHPADFFSKYMRGLNYLTGELPFLTHPIVMILFCGSLFAARIPRRARFLMYSFLIMMVIELHVVAISVSPVEPLIRHFVPFIPGMVAFAFVGLDQALQRISWQRIRPVMTALVVVLVGGASFRKGGDVSYEPIYVVNEEETAYLREIADRNAVVTDQVWELAWKADLISIWAPAKYLDFREYLPDVNYVFFSGTLFEPAPSVSYRAEYIANPEFAEQFDLAKKFDNGGMVFIRRRKAPPTGSPESSDPPRTGAYTPPQGHPNGPTD